MSGPSSSIVIVMGVAGSGKTTVAEALAKRLSAEFLDGDDYHPRRNVEKMASGQPLTDADRDGWLTILSRELRDRMNSPRHTVLACSALKEAYRRRLRILPSVRFVYLKGTFDLMESRLRQRQGHFMRAEMLRSQFATLEEPAAGETDVWVADAAQPVSAIVDRTADHFRL